MQEMNLRNYAYFGDALWELYIREKTIFMTNNSQKLHKITTDFVKTHFQYELLLYLEEYLTDEEKEIVKRARNLPIPVGRRNIQHEYRYATAFETILGYTYINNKSRYEEIMGLLKDKINL